MAVVYLMVVFLSTTVFMTIISKRLALDYGLRMVHHLIRFAANTINGANGDRGIVVDGSKTSNNIFKDNHISNAKYSIRVTGGNTNTKFINNHLDTVAPSGEYTLGSSSALEVEVINFPLML